MIHIIPERGDLGIGGCWNVGAMDPRAGKFCVQLDSDDVYADENTLAKMVKAFYDNNAGMVVGTYMLTDINMQPIPPGVIDHKEWTPRTAVTTLSASTASALRVHSTHPCSAT